MRGFAGALAALVAGGVLVLVASGRVWSTTVVDVPGAPASPVSVTGHAVEPSLPALGIALLALVAAVIAARGRLRRLVGAVVVVVGAGALAVAVAGRSSVSAALTSHEVGDLGIPVHGSANGWWVVAALGGLIALAAGVAVVARGGRWAAMGRKYEAPQPEPRSASRPDASDSAWDALDRGEDPTT